MDLEYTHLENDVEDEIEGIAGGDTALGEGCVDECVIQTRTKDLEPVCKVLCRLHWFMALFEFHPVANIVTTIKIIESIAIPTVWIADK